MSINTHVALDKVTVLSDTPSITFTGISGSYTDLVIVSNAKYTSTNTGQGLGIRFNNDSSTNYSATLLEGNGSAASSYRSSNSSTSPIGAVSNGSQTSYSTVTTSIQNYSSSSVYKSIITTCSGPSFVQNIFGLWRATPQAITSVTILATGTAGNIAAGSTFALYGIQAVATSPTVKATGGTVYSDATYYYHVFGSSGTFTPTQSITADCLVVAGGAGGGRSGGGGGAGGLLAFTSQSLTATGYTVTVGSGGAGNNTDGQTGTVGGDSQFGALTLVKGGGGGGSYGANGATGGSGGGGGGYEGTARTGGAATSGQGNSGGNGFAGSLSTNRAGGGGGGAGASGAAATSAVGGNGGVGLSSYSSWGVATGVGQNVLGTYYLAGGGGAYGSYLGGTGGYGGGGNKGVNAVANTGGGGGGSASDGTTGFNGGSGVVIVRYAK